MLDAAIVERALATTPASFTLTPRNPVRRVTLGGNHLAFGLVAGPPNVHDLQRGRRPGNYRDYCDFIRLAQYFNAVHVIGNQVCAPVELPANTRHLDTYRANLVYSDRAYHCTAIGAGRARDGIAHDGDRAWAFAGGDGRESGVITIISVNSPRRFDEAMSDGLVAMAEHGQPVVITPFTLMGAMAPVTLAAALAQQNAEALFGVVLAQAVRPGTPVMYGAFTSNVDMRSGAPCVRDAARMRRRMSRAASSPGAIGLPYRDVERQRIQCRRCAGRVRNARCRSGARCSAAATSSITPPAGRRADSPRRSRSSFSTSRCCR